MKKIITNNSVDVSIILVNYKTPQLCADIVESIYKKTTGLKYEIVIVDNSNDKLEFKKIETLKEYAVLVNPEQNLGFGKGNNLGAKNAKGEYLLFLNTDTLLVNNAVFELYNFMEKNKNAGIVGANLFTPDMNPCASYELFEKNIKNDTSFIRFLFKKMNKNYYFNQTKRPLKIHGYISGACMMIRKELFDDIGGFSDDIFMYAEESLLCFQAIKKMNANIYNVPSAKVIHYEGSSFKKCSFEREKNFAKGNYMYYKIAFGDNIASKFVLKYLKLLKNKIIIMEALKKDASYLRVKYDAFNSLAFHE